MTSREAELPLGRTVGEVLIHTGLSLHLPGADACSWTGGDSKKVSPLPRLSPPYRSVRTALMSRTAALLSSAHQLHVTAQAAPER